MTTRLSRRRFLLRAGQAAAITLPFIRSFNAHGQSATPKKRLFIFATANGTVMNELWPGSSTTYPTILKPLQALQPKVNVLRGLDSRGAIKGGQDGFPGHVPDFPALLTGRAAGAGSGYNLARMEGISIDQHVANAVGGATRLRSKELGVGAYTSGYNLLARGPQQPVTPDLNPYNAFSQMFANVVTGTNPPPSGPDPALVALHARRKSIFDAVRGELSDLRCRLGSEDRIAFEAHLESIRELERELTFDPDMQPDPGPVNSCTKPAMGASVDVRTEANYPKLTQLMMDITAAAFACDVTRVITLQFHHGASGVRHSWASSEVGGKSHHGIGHNSEGVSASGADRTRWLVSIETWFATQFAYLAKKLDAIPDGPGKTLLDNSALVWAHEQTDGGSHQRTDMPFVIAGSCGGAFRTGVNVNFNGRATNDLLVTLAQAMDVPTTTFGTAEWVQGPLTAIKS
ncbi:MAG: DUF1552 domain-containing protein [Myxococcaceae bacterium]